MHQYQILNVFNLEQKDLFLIDDRGRKSYIVLDILKFEYKKLIKEGFQSQIISEGSIKFTSTELITFKLYQHQECQDLQYFVESA